MSYSLEGSAALTSPRHGEDRVVAVVVTYQPNRDELWRLLDALEPQVREIMIVDNGSARRFDQELGARRSERIFLIQLETNRGVGEGQNIGIRWARSRQAEFVVLFDQDSVPDRHMVRTLIGVAREKTAGGERIAAVGPTNVDGRWNRPLPFVRVNGCRYERAQCPGDQRAVDVDHVISSGALIPLAAIDAVGEMSPSLFVDYVDIEWGLRAASKGLKSYGACGAYMTHSLGNRIITLGSRTVVMHSPRRDYYLFRNAVWMLRQSWVPRGWKWAEAKRLVLRFAIYGVFGRPWLDQMRYMTLGVVHGLMGRMGSV